LVEAIDDLELGDSQQVGNAHFIPILVKDIDRPRNYITAHEAIKAGVLELRDSGRIDALIAINKGDNPILFIAGMDVHAEGTQSRVIIGSHLVPPKAKVELPCRCTHDVHPISRGHGIMTDVEHYSVANPSVRALTLGTELGTQDRVWSKVREYREELKSKRVGGQALLDQTESTSRLAEVQTKAAKQLKAELAKVKIVPKQVGLAVISEGKVRAIEVFDCPETYSQFHHNLAARFAMEIATEKVTPPKALHSLRKEMLTELRRMSLQLKVKDGVGTIRSEDKVLSSLVNKKKKILHLCMERL
jgi:hypothetical protein